MEKYSKFRDPLTGINPFINPTRKHITFPIFLFALLRLPIYLLYLCGLPVIRALIRINRKDNLVPKGQIICNFASDFDKAIIKSALGLSQFEPLKHKTSVSFPEMTASNNKGILLYRSDGAEYSIGLKYNEECIYMYGNRLLWLIRFLGTFNKVDITVMKGGDLSKATGLPRLMLDSKDKVKFISLVKKEHTVKMK